MRRESSNLFVHKGPKFKQIYQLFSTLKKNSPLNLQLNFCKQFKDSLKLEIMPLISFLRIMNAYTVMTWACMVFNHIGGQL